LAALTTQPDARLSQGSPNGGPFLFSAQAGDTMPFDPSSPFDPTDPAQWWRLRNLPHILVKPNAPPGMPSGSAAGDDGPDDWFVPEEDGFPNDWIYPNNNNALAPSQAPGAAPPAPSPQPNPAVANRAPERLDPYHAFWSQMPASRAGAMAWHPPIFLSPDPSTWLPPTTSPNSLGQFPSAANAAPSLPPDFGPGGIFGGIGRMLAEQAKANDPLERLAKNSIFGGIPKLLAASDATNPWDSAANSFVDGIAKPSTASAPAAIPSIDPAQGPFAPWPSPFSGPLPPVSGVGDQYPQLPLPSIPAPLGQSADTTESQIFDKTGFFPPNLSATPLASTAAASLGGSSPSNPSTAGSDSNPLSRFLNALNPISPAFAADEEGPGFLPAIAQAVAQGLIDAATAKELTERAKVLQDSIDAWEDLRDIIQGKSSRRALGRALEASGVSRPPGYAAHHIVAGNKKPAAGARDILKGFRIGINDASNGVFLPADRTTQVINGEAIHASLHTNEYFKAVEEALKKATSREEALGILQRIRQGLQSRTFP
jgi:hypothetical protein